MARFTIQPHGRLHDWIADAKGYFTDEGLDCLINAGAGYRDVPLLPEAASDAPVRDLMAGAFERYAAGDGRKGAGGDAGDVSCACHWAVNEAARLHGGRMYGKAYSVCEAAIVVPGESAVQRPEDLAGVEVAVGYHSGSHFSALQALETFLEPKDIALKFVGTSWSRVDAALTRKVAAVNIWGPQLYLVEQQGFRRIASTTFMMGFMFPADADPEDVERYMRALLRAQADIDVEPEACKHYYLNEIPERFLDTVDVRRFGTGERVVPQPYTRAIFERTQKWMHDRALFDVGAEIGANYDEAVLS